MSSRVDQIEDGGYLIVGFALLGIVGFVLYEAYATGKGITNALSNLSLPDSIKKLLPTSGSVITQPAGTSIQVGGTTFGTTPVTAGSVPFARQSSGTISFFDASGKAQDYGPSYILPGSGNSINDLRLLGYSDAEIIALIKQSEDDSPVIGGGATGSW